MVQLFKMFHRASDIENVKGTGLGLSIDKICVEAYSGQISFVNQENQDPTFTVKIPLTQD